VTADEVDEQFDILAREIKIVEAELTRMKWTKQLTGKKAR
jgi:hypothetical protein